jgi:hypothetical protein
MQAGIRRLMTSLFCDAGFTGCFMDEHRQESVIRRACCVDILEKGKPVEKPGRKARGRQT